MICLMLYVVTYEIKNDWVFDVYVFFEKTRHERKGNTEQSRCNTKFTRQ